MSSIKLNTGYRLPHWLESLTFHICFPVVRTNGRAYGHVITKIFRMDRLPNFRRHGAPLARAKPATILVLDLCPFPNKTNMNKINKEKEAVTVVYKLHKKVKIKKYFVLFTTVYSC